MFKRWGQSTAISESCRNTSRGGDSTKDEEEKGKDGGGEEGGGEEEGRDEEEGDDKGGVSHQSTTFQREQGLGDVLNFIPQT